MNQGELLTPPVNPFREGFMFNGWFLDLNLTNEFNFSTPITRSLILYAAWVNDQIYFDGMVDKTITLGTNFDSLENVQIISKFLGNITDQVTIQGYVNQYNPDTYKIKYSVTGSDGVIYYHIRTIIVAFDYEIVEYISFDGLGSWQGLTLSSRLTSTVEFDPFLGVLFYSSETGLISNSRITVHGEINPSVPNAYVIQYEILLINGDKFRVYRTVIVECPLSINLTFLHLLPGFYNVLSYFDYLVQGFKFAHPEFNGIRMSMIPGMSNNDIRRIIFDGCQYVTNTPNLVFSTPELIDELFNHNLIQSLTPLIDDRTLGFTEVELNDFIPSFFDFGRNFGFQGFENDVFSLPFSRTFDILIYNKTMLEKHNMSLSNFPTFDEILEISQVIKTTEDIIPFGYDNLNSLLASLFFNENIEFVNYKYAQRFTFLNNDGAKSVINSFINQFIDIDSGSLFTSGLQQPSTFTSDSFNNQQLAMTVTNFQSIFHFLDNDSLGFERGIVAAPNLSNQNNSIFTNGTDISVLRGTGMETEIAWQFLRWLLLPEHQLKLAAFSLFVPVLSSSINNLSNELNHNWNVNYNLAVDTLLSMVNHSCLFFSVQASLTAPQMRLIERTFNDVLFNNLSIDSMFKYLLSNL